MKNIEFLQNDSPQAIGSSWLPMTKGELDELGIGTLDFVLVTGDAYIDHPSFGAAIIGRTLQAAGYTVGIIAQPDWHGKEDFMRLGRPRLGFLVTAGNLDSMVNHYTSAKKRRSEDSYSPGGKAGFRPDRATVVYCNRIKEAYRNIPIIIGGIEASLRRFAHYDYWDDCVRNSILIDSGADLLIYSMGERAVIRAAEALDGGLKPSEITYIAGTCYTCAAKEKAYDCIELPSLEEIKADKRIYAKAFMMQQQNQDAISGKRLVQKHGQKYLVANPPAMPLTTEELDAVYELPYTRKPHPSYKEHIPALDEVEFSLVSCRGCFGGCSFCALTMHQGRRIQVRSHASLEREARILTKLPNFKGYIHDVGGATANFRQTACKKQLKDGVCASRQCLGNDPCKNLEVSHEDYVTLLRRLRGIDGVKKVFVRSGIRYDYVMYDKSDAFLRELILHHVSGQLKVAPEHVDDRVLDAMGKPHSELYDRFVQKYAAINKSLGLKQYVIPYLMSSHPGSDIHAAIRLAEYLKRTGQHIEQVQDFYPTPGTVSTTMYYTGLDPRTMKPIYVPKTAEEKAMQRALIQYYLPKCRPLVMKALKKADREDLIGYGKNCLIPPFGSERTDKKNASDGKAKRTGAKKPAANRRNADVKRGRRRK